MKIFRKSVYLFITLCYKLVCWQEQDFESWDLAAKIITHTPCQCKWPRGLRLCTSSTVRGSQNCPFRCRERPPAPRPPSSSPVFHRGPNTGPAAGPASQPLSLIGYDNHVGVASLSFAGLKTLGNASGVLNAHTPGLSHPNTRLHAGTS